MLSRAIELTEDEGDIQLKHVKRAGMNLARYIKSIQQNQFADVASLGVNKERLATLASAKVPTHFGTQGLRVLLIKQREQPLFSQMQSLDDLRKSYAGYVAGWADNQILSANKLPSYQASVSSHIYKMLDQGRVNYFPRSVGEVFTNLALNKQKFPQLIIEKDLILYYPYPVYFFVRPGKPWLAQRIERGVKAAMQDGSAAKLFVRFHSKELEDLNIHKRKLLHLQNPELPEDIPQLDLSHWLKQQSDVIAAIAENKVILH